MSLIVEDGTARADAESYMSVAEADTYHSDRGNAAWTGTTPQKEQWLRKATEYMVQTYRERWLSFRVTATQALDWPRAWVQVKDAPYGYGSFAAMIPNNVVPVEVKRACGELALQAISGDLAPALERVARREKVDVIEVEYDAGSPAYKRFRNVDMLLSPLLRGSGAMSQLVRT